MAPSLVSVIKGFEVGEIIASQVRIFGGTSSFDNWVVLPQRSKLQFSNTQPSEGIWSELKFFLMSMTLLSLLSLFFFMSDHLKARGW